MKSAFGHQVRPSTSGDLGRGLPHRARWAWPGREADRTGLRPPPPSRLLGKKDVEGGQSTSAGRMTAGGRAAPSSSSIYPVVDCANPCGRVGKRYLSVESPTSAIDGRRAAALSFSGGDLQRTINIAQRRHGGGLARAPTIALLAPSRWKANRPLSRRSRSSRQPLQLGLDRWTRPDEDELDGRRRRCSRKGRAGSAPPRFRARKGGKREIGFFFSKRGGRGVGNFFFEARRAGCATGEKDAPAAMGSTPRRANCRPDHKVLPLRTGEQYRERGGSAEIFIDMHIGGRGLPGRCEQLRHRHLARAAIRRAAGGYYVEGFTFHPFVVPRVFVTGNESI